MTEIARRAFLRAAGLAALGAAAACTGGSPERSGSSPTPSRTPVPPPSTPAPMPAAWRRIEAAGPPARRDATLTYDAERGVAYLFGGRSGGTPRRDLWVLDVSAGTWRAIPPGGPSPRFGHDAGLVDGKLTIFGGQGGSNTFFNDVHVWDPATEKWTARPKAEAPAPRYGSGDAVVDGRMLISHGFTNSGRFDDTWTWDGAWTNVSAPAGVRPVKRCLHRIAWWPERSTVALFGGQTNGTPFLNDFWLYDPAAKTWTQQQPGVLPGPRNLFAMFALAGRLWVFGGFAQGGEIGDLWSSADPALPWTQQPPADPAPLPRGGMAVTVAGEEALMFGGRRGDADLAELWAFRPGTA